MRIGLVPLLAVVSLPLLLGCSSSPTSDPADGLPAECHPLRIEGVCASPYPASHYLVDDPSTETGVRLALTSNHFPVNASGVPFDPTEVNRRDGFPASTPLLVLFEDRLGVTGLPSWQAPEDSLGDGSVTLLIDTDSGERVPHFAELDNQASPDEQQALILRPTGRLRHGVRYVAAVRSSLTREDGTPASGPAGWASSRNATVVSALEADGTAPDDVLIAWDFVTASEASSTTDIASMAQAVLSDLPPNGLGYTITSIDEDFSPTTLRRIEGTFTVPMFVSHADFDRPDIAMVRDEDGRPMQNGTYEAPFALLVPRSAGTTPARLLMYGHGFINTAEGAFGQADAQRFPQVFGESHGYAFIGTNWWGLSADETASGAIPMAVSDMNNLSWLSVRLTQSVINQMVLARTAKAIAADPMVTTNAAIDTTVVDFMGISLGGIMGSVFLAYTPDIQQAVLHVGAASWSTILQRSKLWGLFRIFVDDAYETPWDRLRFIATLQQQFVEVDGLTRADTLTARGNVLFQMGLHDDSVTNVASAMLARSMGLSTLDDSPIDVPLMPVAAGPVDSAFTVWDTGQNAPPTTNVANPTSSDNTIHDQLRNVPALQTQIDHFLRMGEVVSTCDGPCDPE